jgi:phospholipase D1/2
LIFSTTFGFVCGEAATGYAFGVLVNSSHRALQLDAEDVFTLGLFVHFLAKAVQESKNIRQNRFGSFARVRSGCEAEYFVDGQDYFDSLCDCLLAARKEIFITGWMISPYFSLRRPDEQEEYRLDNVLGKVARAGIKVNIVIYNAPKMALAIDSEFSQKYLMSLSANIRVLMHPNYLMVPFLWSHHEKMVIVDQTTAYLGGLDLGYGRFDSKQHFLTDPVG